MCDEKNRPTFSFDEENKISRCQIGGREFLFSRTPYDSQIRLINSMRDTIENGQLGWLESPTGTGKTLSVITSVYSWLLDVHNNRIAITSHRNCRTKDSRNVPSFVESWDKKNARCRLEEEINQKRKFKRRAGTPREPACGENGKDNTNGNSSIIKYLVPKVVFLSRTHSQLTQFVKELKNTPYNLHCHHPHGSVFLLSLAGRKHTCLNKTVTSQCGGDSEKLNEMCLELGTSCPYRNRERINNLADSIAHPVPPNTTGRPQRALTLTDIEELGEMNSSCPYYTSRAALPAADIVVAPYSLLLDEGALNESGIELDGSVVIFDEAHNVIPACHDALTAQISAESIDILKRSVFSPEDSTQSKSLAQTKVHYYSLHTICTRLLSFMTPSSDHRQSSNIHEGGYLPENFPKNKRIYSVSNFLEISGVSSYNFFSLADFILSLASKVKSHPNQRYKKLLSALRRFLLKLSSDENDSIIVFDLEIVSLKIVGLCAKRIFHPILSSALAIIMLSGTLQPRAILEAELIRGYCSREDAHSGRKISTATFPHVVPDSQIYISCWAESFSGTRFRFSYSKIQAEKGMSFKNTMIGGLSQILLNLCTIVRGGIVMFFTSHEYLKFVCEVFHDNNIVDMVASRGKKLFIEDKNAHVDEILRTYCKEIENGTGSGAVLMGVMGGRLSEGINFSDNYGRVLCVVGLPYANPYDVESYARLKFMKEGKIKFNKPTSVYSNEKDCSRAYEDALCMTIVNQTIGRVIRHKGDHAAILFLDERLLSPSLQNMCAPWVQRNFRQQQSTKESMSTIEEFFALRSFFDRQ